MQHFISSTKGHTVVMGRKTYESIGRPLPKRTNIVLTNNKDLKIEGVEICHDFKKIIEMGKNQDIFIIGGASIYRQFLPYADQLIISKLPDSYKCEEFLNFDLSNFKLDHTIDHTLFKVNYYVKK
ncbi:MAG: dihydrofolate reductase [Mycoplasmoidaceae bacterium]|nr:dihydrofolate reductase [Mycoplasmoidaceae bacterium]